MNTLSHKQNALLKTIVGGMVLAFCILFLQYPNTAEASPYLVNGYTKIGDGVGGFPSGIIAGGDEFGSGVADLGGAVGSRMIAVGYARDDSVGSGRGSVYTMVVNSSGNVVGTPHRISDLEPGGGQPNNNFFGAAVENIGDVNGDGYPDIAVGAPFDTDSPNAGAVFIVFLDANGHEIGFQKISGTQGNFTADLDSNDLFGTTLAAADINGDGRLELIVGAAGDDDGAWDKDLGAVYVLFLNIDGTVNKYQKISATEGNFTPPSGWAVNDSFARSVASIGDLNNDGVQDIVVSAPRADTPGCTSPACEVDGRIYILFLKTDGTVKSYTQIDNTSPGVKGILDGNASLFGSGIAVGEYNGDGINDLIVGIHSTSLGNEAQSALFAIFLNNDGTAKGYSRVTDGSVFLDNDPFAWTAPFAGDYIREIADVNGDGYRDLLVGAKDGETDGPWDPLGSAYILFLNNKLDPLPSVTLDASDDFVAAGSSTVLTWTTTNATDCYASNTAGDSNWDGPGPIWSSGGGPTSNTDATSIPVINMTTQYAIVCEGPGGTAVDYATVEVLAMDGSGNLLPDVVVQELGVTNVGKIMNGDTVNFAGLLKNIGFGNTDPAEDNDLADVVDPEFQQCLADHVGETAWSDVTAQDLLSIGLFTSGVVDCDTRNITDLKGIRHLANASEISFQHNQIPVIPGEAAQLKKVKVAKFADNPLDDIDPVLISLQSGQTTVDYSNTNLTSLPPEVENLTSLTELILNDNNLTSLPPEIGNLTNLKRLILDYNPSLTTLPPEIGNLTELSNLHVTWSGLTTLPPEIGNLTKLQWILASHSNLTSLPPEIGNLKAVNSFWLQGNNLTVLPPEIGDMSGLAVLYFGTNNITTLPPEIGNLTGLGQLSFDTNNITTLPPEIGNLTNLTVLYAWDNFLTTIPPEIGNLTSLTHLSLTNNDIVVFPPEFGNLTSLTNFGLSQNLLNVMPPKLTGLNSVIDFDVEAQKAGGILDCSNPSINTWTSTSTACR